MKPYYSDDHVTIYHGNCLDVLPEIGQVDLVLTDPPFSATTHANAKTIRWHKNGDHPDDNVGEVLEDPLSGASYVRQEGAVVRYFRHPDIPDLDTHTECGRVWRDHGWIDQADGRVVCPGDLVTTLDDGTRRVEHPDALALPSPTNVEDRAVDLR